MKSLWLALFKISLKKYPKSYGEKKIFYTKAHQENSILAPFKIYIPTPPLFCIPFQSSKQAREKSWEKILQIDAVQAKVNDSVWIIILCGDLESP